MFIKDLLKEFVFDLQIKNYSDRTIETYNYNTTHFIQYLNEFHEVNEIEDVSTVHVKKYVQHQLNLGKKATYINTLIKSLRSFYTYLVAEEYITLNIMARIKLLKEDITIIQTFTDKEIAKMIEAYDFKTYLNARNKIIIAMFADTAIRCSELINLEVDWVQDTTLKIFGKGAKWRYVPISLMLRKYMIRYERIREGYLKSLGRPIHNNNYFLSRSGRPLTTAQIEVIVREAGEKAKVRGEIRCSPHTIRHYAIQANLRNGLDVYSCSRIAGHENIQTTKRYLQGIETENILEMAQKTSPLMNLK